MKKPLPEHTRKYRDSEIVHTDGFKQEWRNVGFAAVFKNETIRGTLSIAASIYTAKIADIEMTLKRIKHKGNITGQCTLTLKAQ